MQVLCVYCHLQYIPAVWFEDRNRREQVWGCSAEHVHTRHVRYTYQTRLVLELSAEII